MKLRSLSIAVIFASLSQIVTAQVSFPANEDEFDEVNGVGMNDSLFIARKRNDYFIFNAFQRKMSSPYSKIEYQGGIFIVSRNGKSGLSDLDMKEVVPCTMEEIKMLKCGDNYYYRLKGKYYGLSDAHGKLLLDTIYIAVEDRGNLVVFKSDSGYGFLNSKGERIPGLEGMTYLNFTNVFEWVYCGFGEKAVLLHVPTQKIIEIPKGSFYDRAIQIAGLPEYFSLRNSKYDYGLMDSDGKLIVPVGKYDDLSRENSPIQFMNAKDHAVILFNDDGKLGFKRLDDLKVVQNGLFLGEVSIPFMYALKTGNAYALVDQELKPVNDTRYRNLEQSEYVILAQNMEEKYGAINERGEELIPFAYDGFESNIWQYSALKKGDEYHLYNQQHERVFEDLKITGADYSISEFEDMFMQLETGNTKTLISVQQNKVILKDVSSIEYNEDLFYTNNQAVADIYETSQAIIVHSPAGTGLFSLNTFEYLIEPKIQTLELEYFHPTESFVMKAKKLGKYNLYDPSQHKFLFETGMDEVIFPKKGDVILAVNDGKLYIIAADYDHPQLQIIQTDLQYKKAVFMQEYDIVIDNKPVLRVEYKGKKGLLRTDGVWIHKPELESFDYLHMDMYLTVRKNGLSYVVTTDGKYLTEKGFDVIEFFGDGGDLAHGYIGGQEYRISEDGGVKLIEADE